MNMARSSSFIDIEYDGQEEKIHLHEKLNLPGQHELIVRVMCNESLNLCSRDSNHI